MIVRVVVLTLMFAVLFLLEAVVAPAIAFENVPPDLTMLAVIGLALSDGPATGARVGFFAGAARDLLTSTTDLVGPWMLFGMLVGYGAGLLRPYVAWSELPSHVVVGTLGVVGAWLGVELLGFVLGTGAAAFTDVLARALVAGGWAIVLSPIVCRGVQALSARTTVAAPPAP